MPTAFKKSKMISTLTYHTFPTLISSIQKLSMKYKMILSSKDKSFKQWKTKNGQKIYLKSRCSKILKKVAPTIQIIGWIMCRSNLFQRQTQQVVKLIKIYHRWRQEEMTYSMRQRRQMNDSLRFQNNQRLIRNGKITSKHTWNRNNTWCLISWRAVSIQSSQSNQYSRLKLIYQM